MKKLNLNELKVKSFVTNFDNRQQETVKGGSGRTDGQTIESCFLCTEGEDNTEGETFFCNSGTPAVCGGD